MHFHLIRYRLDFANFKQGFQLRNRKVAHGDILNKAFFDEGLHLCPGLHVSLDGKWYSIWIKKIDCATWRVKVWDWPVNHENVKVIYLQIF